MSSGRRKRRGNRATIPIENIKTNFINDIKKIEDTFNEIKILEFENLEILKNV